MKTVQLEIPFPPQTNMLNVPIPTSTGEITEHKVLQRINERMNRKLLNELDETDWENQRPRARMARQKTNHDQMMLDNDDRLSHLDELHRNMYEDREERNQMYRKSWKG